MPLAGYAARTGPAVGVLDELAIATLRRDLNATVIDLEDAPQGYQDFDSGTSVKYVLDPHGDLQGAQRA